MTGISNRILPVPRLGSWRVPPSTLSEDSRVCSAAAFLCIQPSPFFPPTSVPCCIRAMVNRANERNARDVFSFPIGAFQSVSFRSYYIPLLSELQRHVIDIRRHTVETPRSSKVNLSNESIEVACFEGWHLISAKCLRVVI